MSARSAQNVWLGKMNKEYENKEREVHHQRAYDKLIYLKYQSLRVCDTDILQKIKKIQPTSTQKTSHENVGSVNL